MTRAALLLTLVTLAACSKSPPPRPTATASASAVAAVAPVAAAPASPGHELVKGACLSCHAEEMLAQQRLPKEKWAATVKKMAGWGANLDPSEFETLATYLAASYGPDAGPWEPVAITAAAARSAIDPLPDGEYADGDKTHGAKLFGERCSACHAPDGQGGIGVNLVERPILYRAEDVAASVRGGRGKMPPTPIRDRDLADVLAYLRTLRVR